jgi:glutamyl-tRNA reductase
METGNWRLVACAATHKTSSLEEREPLQIGNDEIARANAVFGGLPAVLESAIVSTCNRVEFYFVTGRDNDPVDVVATFYGEFRGLDPGPHRRFIDVQLEKEAARHLFRVAAGIDSMVLGENQVQGQLKEAYRSACAVKSAGKVIHRLFHQAFRVGKRVRTETAIGKGACSVSTAAVEMLEGTLRSLDNPRFLFIGVNQTIRLAARRLARIEGARFVFANRTESRAAEFANGFRGVESSASGLERLVDLIADADVVVSCTSSPEPLVTGDVLGRVAGLREGRRQTVVDLAIPRDVEVSAEGLDPSVTVCDLEDVKRFVAGRQRLREQAVPRAEEIIDDKLREFAYWYGQVLHEPAYNGGGLSAEEIRREELGSLMKELPPTLREQLDRATRRLVDRVVKAAKSPPAAGKD